MYNTGLVWIQVSGKICSPLFYCLAFCEVKLRSCYLPKSNIDVKNKMEKQCFRKIDLFAFAPIQHRLNLLHQQWPILVHFQAA